MPKLMLVEDDNNLREIYEARLQAEGYTIVTAKDGEEALVVAKAEKPDLIISDVMMPKISGFEMLDILRNTDELKAVKVIMLTALGQSDDQQRADRLGADRYLVKSQVTLEDIVKVTHELLGDQPTPAAASTDASPVNASPAATDATVPLPAAPPPAAAATPVAAPPVPEPAVAPDATPPPVSDSSTSSTPPASTPDTAKPAAAAISQVPATDSVALSTVQEEADVEAKIENFVAGATSEPTEPSTAAATTAPDEASDDKLMSDAVQTLVASTDQSEEPAAPTVTEPVTTEVVPDSITPAAAPETPEASEPTTDTEGGSVPIAHKKVTTPLDNPQKKDLSTLLALEEVAEKTVQPAPPPTAIVSTNEGGPQAVPVATPTADTPASTPKIGLATSGTPPVATEPDEPVDPNSIAL